MKVLLLSDINSSHTQKWVRGLRSRGYDLFLFSLNPIDPSLLDFYSSVDFWAPVNKFSDPRASGISKSRYLFSLRALRKYVKKVSPHLVHAHYATSYGLLGALTASSPFIVSTWGSDILDFPLRSSFNRRVLKFILAKSDAVTAASQYLRHQTMLYTTKPVEVIPFGIEGTFADSPPAISPFRKGEIIVGVVKTMSETYGVDIAIRAFHKIVSEHADLPVKLLVVGGGPKLDVYRNLASELGIARQVHFTGAVPYSEVAKYHGLIDIFVNLSRYESFGVSVLESFMYGNPAIVSDVGGLPELVTDGENGFVVPSEDADSAASAMLKLITGVELRSQMGNKAKQEVMKYYLFENNLDKMGDLYTKVAGND